MKRAISLFLLIPVLLHAGVMMLLCMLLQLKVQSHIDQVLQNNATHFERLTLSTESYFNNRLDDKEVIIAGKIFDVKSVTFHKNYVELLAFNDTDEEGLIAVIESFFSSSSDSKKDYPVQVLKLLVSVYTLPKQEIKFSRTLPSLINISSLSEAYHSFSDEPFSPPPEIIA